MFVFWSGAEIPRFYFGYVGNLNERVPQMSAFLLTTLFPQLPSILYLTVVQEHKFPFDQIAGYMMLALLLLEMVVGYNALRALIRRKTAQFYRLCQDEEVRSCYLSNATRQLTAAPPEAHDSAVLCSSHALRTTHGNAGDARVD